MNSSPNQVGPTDEASQAKHALLIGIDEYPLIAGAQLLGAVNDADAMRSFLIESLGFRSSEIRCLKNEQATRKAILEAFTVLGRDVTADALVIVHFSGHGSQCQ